MVTITTRWLYYYGYDCCTAYISLIHSTVIDDPVIKQLDTTATSTTGTCLVSLERLVETNAEVVQRNKLTDSIINT